MLSDDLQIVLIQPDILWKDPAGNLKNYSSLLHRLAAQPDLILLPEMFTTGFCTEPADLAETMNGKTVQWMRETASSLRTAIAGSLIISENGRYYNRLIFVHNDANIRCYDKRHLFRMSGEEEHFTPGTQQLVVAIHEWRISFQICYDLRFPVWSRNRNQYDLLVYAANWPSQRSEVWNTLLKARALENQTYVAGVNRVGTDGNGIFHAGESKVIDAKGKEIAALESSEGILHAAISLSDLNRFREKFPVWKDGDEFEIRFKN